MFHLVVTQPFGPYSRGERITDPATVAEIEAGEHAHCVVRVSAPEVEHVEPKE